MAYLFQVNLYLLLVYSFYWLLLRKETFHQQNRIILLGGVCVSLLMPLMPAGYLTSLITPQSQSNFESLGGVKLISMVITETTQASGFNWQTFLVLVYGLGIAFMLIRLIINTINLRRLLTNGLRSRAFSFLNKTYVDASHPQQEVIQSHEDIHAQQLHSLDLILIEILLVFNWFNPVLYMIRQSLKDLHEYIADEAASQLIGKASYARLLLSEQFDVSEQVFVNSFYQFSTLKKRITMLAKEKSTSKALFKYGFSLPIFGIMVLISSSFVSEKVAQNQTIRQLNQVIGEVVTLSPPAISTQKSPENVSNKSTLGQAISAEALPEDISQIIEKSTSDNLEPSTIDSISKQNPPLFILDGLEMPFEHMAFIEPSTIKLINVYKGDKALQLYGKKGKNGVIEMFTTLKEEPSSKLPAIGAHNLKENEEIFTHTEETASFVGGSQGMNTFISKNMIYPAPAQRAMVEGKVYVSFIVEPNGSISDTKVIRSIGFGCDEEALRLIELMPKWKPAKQAGIAVRQEWSLAIDFTLPKSKKR